MMMNFWRTVTLCTVLFTQTLQHSSVHKPPSVNGCYHGDEGTFFWSVSGDYLYLNITSHLLDKEWVAIGFSDDTAMGQDDVVAVFMDTYSNKYVAASLINPNDYDSTRVQEMESIEDFQTAYVDGRVEANITKSLGYSFPFDDLDKQPVFLFFGKGRIRLPEEENSDIKPLHIHYENPTISRDPVPLYENSLTCISTQTHILLKFHGILMVLVWLNITPLAVYIARYAKYYFKRQTLWFTIHKYSGFLSGIVVIASVVVAHVALQELELERHQLVGIGVILLLLLHILMAICRPAHEARYRRLWEILHKVSAGLLLIGSFTNTVNGLFMLKAHSSCYVVISLQITIFCILFMILENPQQVGRALSRICICLRLSPQIYYSLNTQYKDENSDTDCEDITMVTMNLDNTNTKTSFVSFGLWTVVIINTVVSVTVISALANT
ncbi:hypothetical protein ACHWQZ_G007496 [Mnemiopsis leidyi]